MIEKELVLPHSDAKYEPRACGRLKQKSIRSPRLVQIVRERSMRSFRVQDCRDGKTGERKASLYLST